MTGSRFTRRDLLKALPPLALIPQLKGVQLKITDLKLVNLRLVKGCATRKWQFASFSFFAHES